MLWNNPDIVSLSIVAYLFLLARVSRCGKLTNVLWRNTRFTVLGEVDREHPQFANIAFLNEM